MRLNSAEIELLDFLDEPGQFLDRGIDVGALRSEFGDMCLALFDSDSALFHAAIVKIVQVDHLANFGQAEADIFGAGSCFFRKLVNGKLERAT